MAKDNMKREELFESVPVLKAIFILTIPMIMGSIVSMIYNLADTYFVGMLNDPVQNAAVTLAAPAMTLFYGVTNLFGIGASSLMSRSLGVKDYKTVKKASATGVYLALFCAALLSFLVFFFNDGVLHLLGTTTETYAMTKSYMMWTVCFGAVPGIMNILFGYLLRAEGQSVHASVGTMSGCLLNIILDPFFILPWGLNLGAAGAGFATFLSNCFACGYFLVFLWRKKGNTCVCVDPGMISFEGPILSNIFIVGVPGVFQNILNVVSMTILNNIAAGYGANAVAAIGIANKINQLPVQIIFGFSQGVMPLIGYTYASRNTKRLKSSINHTFVITLSSLLLVSLLFNLEGKTLIRIFMNNTDIIAIGAKFLSGYGLSLPFMCIDFTVVGISQSFGYGKHALIFSFLRKAFLEVPFILILSYIFGLYGMAYAQFCAEFIVGVIALFVLRGLLRGVYDRDEA